MLRLVIAFACIGSAALLHHNDEFDIAMGLALWFVLAASAGFLLPHFWMLLMAPIPWIAGVGVGIYLENFDGLQGHWYIPLILSTMTGAIGILLGAGIRRTRTHPGDSSV